MPARDQEQRGSERKGGRRIEEGHGGVGARRTEHREAAVVDLDEQAVGLGLVRPVLVEVERVVQVERARVRDAPAQRLAGRGLAEVERRVVARLAALHVVRLPLALQHELGLRPRLEDANHADNLQLGGERDRVPHRRSREALEGRVVRQRRRERPRPARRRRRRPCRLALLWGENAVWSATTASADVCGGVFSLRARCIGAHQWMPFSWTM
eukprot:40787-Prymnesium_polylepis.2